MMMAPKSCQLRVAVVWRGNEDNWRATSASTRNAKSASSVIRIDCELSSFSDCESRSAAIQAGSLYPSATTSISDGPEIITIPTVPKTCRFAAATQACPRTEGQRRGKEVVHTWKSRLSSNHKKNNNK